MIRVKVQRINEDGYYAHYKTTADPATGFLKRQDGKFTPMHNEEIVQVQIDGVWRSIVPEKNLAQAIAKAYQTI